MLSSTQYKEDINGDGRQDIIDVIALLLLGRDNPEDPKADYNGSGSYAVNDAVALLINIMRGNLTPLDETPSPGETVQIQGVKLAFIPADSFQMGSQAGELDEKPVHEVSLDAFWMSITEITQLQYERTTGTNPSFQQGLSNNPVEQVSWYNAVTFCNRLSELASLEPCYDLETWKCDFSKNGFRLPTEAEWEYACRAGTTTKYYTGDSESSLDSADWHSGNSGCIQQQTGQKTPNAWGLHDMHGNVREWCGDWYSSDYYSSSPGGNPTGPQSGSNRACRSASACSHPIYHRSANRESETPAYRGRDMGIRIVRRP